MKIHLLLFCCFLTWFDGWVPTTFGLTLNMVADHPRVTASQNQPAASDGVQSDALPPADEVSEAEIGNRSQAGVEAETQDSGLADYEAGVGTEDSVDEAVDGASEMTKPEGPPRTDAPQGINGVGDSERPREGGLEAEDFSASEEISPNGANDINEDSSPSLAEANPAAGDGTNASLPADGILRASPNKATNSPNEDLRRGPSWLNLRTNILLGVVLACLAIASIVGQYLTRQPTESVNPALVRRFRQRVNAWWLMCAILVFGLLLQPTGTVVLFGLVSFWALREFITMAPTRRGDHRGLFWALIVFTPLQYILIGLERSGIQWRDGRDVDFYNFYSIMIPVYASLYIPARIALAGDHKKFLERSAQITFGLLICVYALSYASALINLKLADSNGVAWNGSPAGLLFFFILIAQLSDILQWTWGQLIGKRTIAPEISSSRTWEGFAAGTLTLGLIGAGLFWVTPFSFWEAACMSMVIGVMGMFGGMTMSAIKRDRGVSDYGSLVLGHAGVLDRIDTLCFAAPVFYHLTRFFFTQAP